MEEFRKLEEKLGVDDEYTEALVSERKKKLTKLGKVSHNIFNIIHRLCHGRASYIVCYIFLSQFAFSIDSISFCLLRIEVPYISMSAKRYLALMSHKISIAIKVS